MGRHKKNKLNTESNIPAEKIETFQVQRDLILPPNLQELKSHESSPQIQDKICSEVLKTETSQIKQCIPPFILKRNSYGLLENLDYKFTENGFVDWRAMIPAKYLYFNNTKTDYIEKKYGKKITEINLETDKIDDEDLCIRTGGYRFLAGIRKFNSVKYTTITAADNYYATKCQIEWSPNYETDGKPVIFEGLAATSYNNTQGYGRVYLAETAENRAFCRCVRNFLNISIVAQEELPEIKDESGNSDSTAQVQSPNATTPRGCLQDILNKCGKNLTDVKEFLTTENYKDADKIEKLEDIGIPKICELIEVFKNLKTDSKI